ncbi:WD repeat-containing protein 24 [Trichinella spiralis]|uniref:WD repeat-containing protein 24 n=1 Tax=Trichinella spiralis TaxID=6334 RepID=UPI0001EFC075|nr:WD repeat-containing protein 24 [Trichinella spiralis]
MSAMKKISENCTALKLVISLVLSHHLSTSAGINGGAHVRDVKFAYNSHILFALADANGMVKFLNVQKPAKPVQLFTAHGGPVLSLDFNPLVENIFATGGRDKIIQIWEYQSTKTKLEDSIITSAPIGQIHWNPLKRTQIASSTLTTDFEIQVWDIRRPCLPCAVFLEHTSPNTLYINYVVGGSTI